MPKGQIWTSIFQKVRITFTSDFFENDYLDHKLQFCSKILNPNFSLHRHFKYNLVEAEVDWLSQKTRSYLQICSS